ncbi:MAG: hypothetical protein ACP5VR_05300 [Acidimicrobiales bacterium]
MSAVPSVTTMARSTGDACANKGARKRAGTFAHRRPSSTGSMSPLVAGYSKWAIL